MGVPFPDLWVPLENCVNPGWPELGDQGQPKFVVILFECTQSEHSSLQFAQDVEIYLIIMSVRIAVVFAVISSNKRRTLMRN